MSTDDKNLPYSERIKLRREQAKEKQLTVAQLIELLKQQPPDAKVCAIAGAWPMVLTTTPTTMRFLSQGAIKP